jgi:hypothetical protein
MNWRDIQGLRIGYNEELQQVKKEKQRLNILLAALDSYEKDIYKSLDELSKKDTDG